MRAFPFTNTPFTHGLVSRVVSHGDFHQRPPCPPRRGCHLPSESLPLRETDTMASLSLPAAGLTLRAQRRTQGKWETGGTEGTGALKKVMTRQPGNKGAVSGHRVLESQEFVPIHVSPPSVKCCS